MPRKILGSGWQFPVALDRNDSLALSHHEEKIAQSIRIILGTAKGERMMRPDFGCNIHEYVFNIIDTATLTLIKSAVKEALLLWEPRIEVLTVKTSTEKLRESTITIDIAYKVRYTNTAHNLVYPFFLANEGK
ncbi:MAG: GPW/gp25 family protein [bacterium]|nr:GPW/gp25 family protein [bacterium]